MTKPIILTTYLMFRSIIIGNECNCCDSCSEKSKGSPMGFKSIRQNKNINHKYPYVGRNGLNKKKTESEKKNSINKNKKPIKNKLKIPNLDEIYKKNFKKSYFSTTKLSLEPKNTKKDTSQRHLKTKSDNINILGIKKKDNFKITNHIESIITGKNHENEAKNNIIENANNITFYKTHNRISSFNEIGKYSQCSFNIARNKPDEMDKSGEFKFDNHISNNEISRLDNFNFSGNDIIDIEYKDKNKNKKTNLNIQPNINDEYISEHSSSSSYNEESNIDNKKDNPDEFIDKHEFVNNNNNNNIDKDDIEEKNNNPFDILEDHDYLKEIYIELNNQDLKIDTNLNLAFECNTLGKDSLGKVNNKYAEKTTFINVGKNIYEEVKNNNDYIKLKRDSNGNWLLAAVKNKEKEKCKKKKDREGEEEWEEKENYYLIFCKDIDEGNIFESSTNSEIIIICSGNLTSLNDMFKNCKNLQNVQFKTNFNTKNVKYVVGMFYGCKKLSSLDLSELNFSNVEDMRSLFYNCSKLEYVNFSNKNTISPKLIEAMFCNCHSLKNVDLSKFNTINVESMKDMFKDCYKLEFNKSNIKKDDISKKFKQYYNDFYKDFQTLELDTTNVSNMEGMFKNCHNLAKFNLSSFKNKKIKNTKEMFFGCKNLFWLDLKNFDTTNIENVESMFSGCEKLTYLDAPKFYVFHREYYKIFKEYCNIFNGKNTNSKFYDRTDTNFHSTFRECGSLGFFQGVKIIYGPYDYFPIDVEAINAYLKNGEIEDLINDLKDTIEKDIKNQQHQ